MRKLVLLAVLLSLCSLNAMAQAPQITQISPAPNTTAAVSSANITITWSTALASTTANADNIKVWGSQTGFLSTASVTLSTNGTVVTIDPANNFKAGEQIYVWVGTGIQSTTNTAMATSQNWSFIAAAQGHGSFTPGSDYPSTNSNLSSITAGDTDGDGDIDIIQTNNNAIELISNNSGTFQRTPFDVSGYRDFNHPRLIDFDNDGDLDVISISWVYYTLFFKNEGANNIVYTTEKLTSDQQSSFASLLNQDDLFDAVKAQSYYFNLSSFNFSNNSLANNTTFSFPGDIDGDKDQDLVTIGINALRILTNDGLGGLSVSTSLSLSNSTIKSTLRLADMNGDGNLDIICSSDTETAVYSKNVGMDYSFTKTIIPSIPALSVFDIADFNGDGALDIVYAKNGSIYTVMNNGTFAFTSPEQIGCYTHLGGLSTVDLNGDLKVDILVAGASSDTKIYLNSPSNGVQLSTSAIAFAPIEIGTNSTTSLTISFTSITQNLTIQSTSTHFTVSLDNINFTSTATITTGATSPQTVHLRFSPFTFGSKSTIVKSSLGCIEYNLSVTGEVSVPDGMVVNTLNDGPGSLRYALENATSGTVITFAGGLGNIFTITGSPITIHHPLNIDFQSLTGGGNIIINSGASAAIQFNCGSAGTVLTGVSIISSHPSGGVISTCPDVQAGKVQSGQIVN